jgi:hypothetical protein
MPQFAHGLWTARPPAASLPGVWHEGGEAGDRKFTPFASSNHGRDGQVSAINLPTLLA